MSDFFIAVVCSCNMNRSMEAHVFLKKRGFKVKSFGTADRIKLPGVTLNRPNYYEFNIPYEYIYNDLLRKDKEFYTRLGLLQMLDRNRKLKLCPEKFQESTERFRVIITCDKIVYNEVLEWFCLRNPVLDQLVHIINIDIRDTFSDATIGAYFITDVVTKMAKYSNLDIEIKQLLEECETLCGEVILHSIMFY